jgi:hypothetical protein
MSQQHGAYSQEILPHCVAERAIDVSPQGAPQEVGTTQETRGAKVNHRLDVRQECTVRRRSAEQHAPGEIALQENRRSQATSGMVSTSQRISRLRAT